MAGHWTKQDDITSVRARRAIAYGDKLAAIVNGTTDESWDALLPMIDAERFVRRGKTGTLAAIHGGSDASR